MKKRILAALCVMALVFQPVVGLEWHGHAHAEEVTTPTDVESPCKLCGDKFDEQSEWVDVGNAEHVKQCIHGIMLESSRHDVDVAFEPFSDTEGKAYCRVCGRSWLSTHWASCTNPTECLNCGAKGVTCEVGHNMSGVWEYDSEKHWSTCPDCGTTLEVTDHTAQCDNPMVCEVCGATDVTISYVEHWGSDWDHDADQHWMQCPGCGEIMNKGTHQSNCANPDVCVECGARGVNATTINHIGEKTYQHDEAQHWFACSVCGGEIENSRFAHGISRCTSPNVCAECGAEGVFIEGPGQHRYGDDQQGHDDLMHWWVCVECGEKANIGVHYATCTEPDVCMTCGATGMTKCMLEHNGWDGKVEFDEMHHWQYCTDCGAMLYKEAHYATCLNPSECALCGAAVSRGNIFHNIDWDNVAYNDESHWWTCMDCGYISEESHWLNCTGSGGCCVVCGQPVRDASKAEILHNMKPYPDYDEEYHWLTCMDCGEKGDLFPHVPSEDDSTKCKDCGAAIPQPTAEPTAEPTEEPVATAEPTTEPTEEPVATDEPTAEPTEEPAATDEPTAEPNATPIPLPTVTAAPAPVVTEAPVHEHTYDVAFISNNDGTHSKTCTAEDCSENLTEPCTLVTTDMGLMTCTACAKCGYAVYTAKAGIATLTEGENVPAVITRVETASIASADGSIPAVVPANTALVVHETTFEVPVTLSEEIKGAVEKVFTAALIKDGESIQPTGQVKLRIPVDEEIVAALEGKLLMLLKEDGTLVEVPFEVIDGEIVFLTEELGVFLLMALEA